MSTLMKEKKTLVKSAFHVLDPFLSINQGVGSVYNFLSSSQQRFEMADQCYRLVTAQTFIQ